MKLSDQPVEELASALAAIATFAEIHRENRSGKSRVLREISRMAYFALDPKYEPFAMKPPAEGGKKGEMAGASEAGAERLQRVDGFLHSGGNEEDEL